MAELQVGAPVDTGKAPDGHEGKMVEKMDNQEGGTPADAGTERPDWLPEKFDTVEAFRESYAELESKLGADTIPTKEEPAKADEGKADDVNPIQAAEDAGVDVGAISDAYARDGEISEANYAALDAAGFGREVVDSYIDGQNAQAELYRSDLLSVVGGEDGFASVSEWAGQNLTESELAAFNEAVSSDNVDTAKLALSGLQARFTAEKGRPPTQTIEGTKSESVSGAYDTWAQVTKDMRDTRYDSDKAFRAEVERKLSLSNF